MRVCACVCVQWWHVSLCALWCFVQLAAAAHRDWEEQHHVLPDLARDEVERRLQSIAMKGGTWHFTLFAQAVLFA